MSLHRVTAIAELATGQLYEADDSAANELRTALEGFKHKGRATLVGDGVRVRLFFKTESLSCTERSCASPASLTWLDGSHFMLRSASDPDEAHLVVSWDQRTGLISLPE